MSERDRLFAAERYRTAIRRACAVFLKHNTFCECQGCTDIVLKLAPPEQQNEPSEVR